MTGNAIESKHFMDNIRTYNNLLAFASFGAQMVKLKSQGPQVFRICGQVNDNTYTLHPEENNSYKYSQLYVIDNEMANNMRLENKNSSNCSILLLNELDKLIRDINPYAAAYKMMYEVEKSERKLKKTSQDIKMYLIRDNDKEKERIGAAACNEVAIVYVGDDGHPPIDRDFCIYSRSSKPFRIPVISQHVDPMTYPLLFPFGEFGWKPNLKSNSGFNKNNNISTLQYYSYKLSIRDTFNPCLNAGKITQQFIVDALTKIESCRLYYIRQEQSTLRTELYTGLMDYIHNQASTSNNIIGKMVILPSSFVGSPRAIQQNYLDSMSICQTFGKPDIFLTMTCNPNWTEIIENIEVNQKPIDRPDIVVRVFNEKVKVLKENLLKQHIFGKIIAYIYVIEFQKRGLPHIHMLLYLDEKDKFYNTENIDSMISAEIPNMKTHPKLYELVKQHMIHGPCGNQNKNSPCMNADKTKCTKNFPKPFCTETQFHNVDGYPIYKRRSNNIAITYSSKK